jgi:outer membrane protein assembly factor BamD
MGNKHKIAAAIALAALLNVSCGFKRKKYDNPITKDTQQPDKVLFDRAVKDIEHGHFETARLTLNTLINTYDTSEYLAKAKLAIADSWYREGGSHGLAQAEAEYKDFILFYPTMEEAAESQEKICKMHFDLMNTADRDPNNALRAEMECRTLITQFPNSRYVPEATQRLREIQEVLAEAEFVAGEFYAKRGSNAAAANRLKALVIQYPLYSKADEALWDEAGSYARMGPRFRSMEGEALQKLVREYPLSPRADAARKRLQSLEMSVPEADPAAVARMKAEQENHSKPSLMQQAKGILRHGPDVSAAAKTGQPTMTNPKPSIPVTVPVVAQAPGVTDVTVAPVTDPTALDTKPDARANPPATSPPATPGATPSTPAATPATSEPAKPAATAPAAGAAPAASAAAAPATAADKKADKKKNDKKKKKTDDKSTTTDSAKTTAPDK